MTVCRIVATVALVLAPIGPFAAHADPVPEGPTRIHPDKVAEPMCFGMLSADDVAFVTRVRSSCKDTTCELGSYLARADKKRAETVGYLGYLKGPTPPERAALARASNPKSIETANEKLAEADLACGTARVPDSGSVTFTLGGYPLRAARDGAALVITNASGVSMRIAAATPDLETVTAIHYSPNDPRVLLRLAIANPDGSRDERFVWWNVRWLPGPTRTPAPWVAPVPGTLAASDVARVGCLGARAADDTMFVLVHTADCGADACTRVAEVVALGRDAAALPKPVRVASARGPLLPSDAALVAGADPDGLRQANAAMAGAVLACQESPVSGSHALVIGATKVAMSVANGGPVLRSELGGTWRDFVPRAGEAARFVGSHPELRTAYLRTGLTSESRHVDGVIPIVLPKSFFHENDADRAEAKARQAAAVAKSDQAASDMAAAIERAKAAVAEEERRAAERAAREAAEREARAAEDARRAAEREAQAQAEAAERARLQATPPGTLEERAHKVKAIDLPIPAAWWHIEHRCLGWSTDEPTVYLVRWFDSEDATEAVLSHVQKDGSYKLVTLFRNGEPWRHMWAGADRKVQTSEKGCVGGDSGALQGLPFSLKVDGTKVMLTTGGGDPKMITRLGEGVDGSAERYVGAVWHPELPYLVLEITTQDGYAVTTRYVWQDLTKAIKAAAPK